MLTRAIKYSTLEKSLFLITLIIAVFALLNFQKVAVNSDAGYYVSIAKEVMNGATPTVDVVSNYTPAAYYGMSLWMKIFGTGYSSILWCLQCIHLLNLLLFWLIIRNVKIHSITKGIFLCLYCLTIFLTQGYTVGLEPFQSAFLQLAFVLFIVIQRKQISIPLTGLSFGIAIMCKQYSIFPAIFFAISLLFVVKKHLFHKLSIILTLFIFMFIPFFLWVFLTKAVLLNSLKAFGFLGNVAISYATSENVGIIDRVSAIFFKALHLNWLFIPPLIYLIIKRKNNFYAKNDLPLICMLLGSLVPVTVRQYGHYFQIVAPWSLALAAHMYNNLEKSFSVNFRFKRINILTIIFPLIGLIIISLVNWKISLSKTEQILILTCFSGICFIFFLSILQYSFRHISSNEIFIAILAVLSLEVVAQFQLMSSIYNGKERITQISEASRINAIVPQGSTVLVVDLPYLYVTANLLNPSKDYSFYQKCERIVETRKEQIMHTHVIILMKNSCNISQEDLNSFGFTLIWNDYSGIQIFERSLHNTIL